MNKRALIGTGLTIAAALIFNSSAFAEVKTNKDAITTVKGTIKTIDKKEHTIALDVKEGSGAGKEKVVEVSGATKIHKDTKDNLHLKDLKEGDELNVSYKKVKEPGPDKKTMVESLKAVNITVLSSADSAGGTNAAPAAAGAAAAPAAAK